MEIYKLVAPSSPLTPFIAYYWILETEVKEKREERILPVGYMQLIFYRSAKAFSKTLDQWQPHASVCGLTNKYTDLLLSGDIQMVGVAFKPYGLKAFFDFSMKQLHNLTVPLDALQDPKLNELEEQVMEAGDPTACISLIEEYLIKRLSLVSDPNYNRLKNALYLAHTIPDVGIEKLSNTSCLSKKQFTRLFAEHIGTNPKDFLRILRFQRTLYILQQNPSISFSELAFLAGYYDHPHFTKEFKTLTGYTPLQYREDHFPYSDYFTDAY